MSSKPLHILAFLAGLGFCFSGFAQSIENLELQSYLTNTYELSNQNWSVSQSPSNHFVYFANSEGLHEYNGIKWKKHLSADNFPVRSVLAHKSGIVFTGSFEDFGYWKSNEKLDLVYHSLSNAQLMEKNDEIWKIYELNGKIYFQSFTSIYIYDFQKVEKIKAPYTMLFMHLLDDRFLVQIIDMGLYWLRDGEFVFVEKSGIFSDKKVHSIVPYGDGKWLICTDNFGLYLYDGEEFTYFKSQASDFLINQTCNAAIQLSDSTFAFGSILNGVILTDKKGNIEINYSTTNGLGNNTVLSFYQDVDKGLWIGLDEGINYIDLMSPFTHYRSKNGALGTIYALLEQDNKLYIGTNHGLFIADIVRRGKNYNFTNVRFVPDSHGQVWTLEKFDNQILCGHNDGTFQVRNERLERISTVTGGWTISPLGDYLIGGTYTGLVIYEKGNNGRWKFRNKISNFREPIRYLETDYLGYIWASHHQKGIFKIELSENLDSVANFIYYPEVESKSFNIKVFKINNRIVFTNSNDIYTFDFVGNEIVPFAALSENLAGYSRSSQIIHHRRNDYWFIMEDKMALFEISMDFGAKLKFEILQDNTQLPQRIIQIISLDENTLLIPNPQSFDAFDMGRNRLTHNTSRLRIERLLFQGSRDSITWFDFSKAGKIPWNANNLTVFFSDPSVFAQTNKSFEYRIKELDAHWHSTSNNHFTYLNLKNGEYTVELRRNQNLAASVVFTVGKPWYYSHFALLIYSGILMLLVWSALKFFRFEINRQKEMVSLELKQNSLEKELDYKSYELMLTMRHVILKDDILTDLQKQIDAIKDQSSKYPVKYIKNMERIISQGLGTPNIEWENAMQNLKLSQQGFFKHLKDKYPELTPNDLRLCSYLRLNFNTKEIAQLLNVSTRGVEISRHRLRKKLKLKQDENLYEFLMNLDFEEL